MKVHFILYVHDQKRSREFYEALLQSQPELDVPGMTEFNLNQSSVLGLMPETSIQRLLPKLQTSADGAKPSRAELYLNVEDADEYFKRALALGAHELSAVEPRDWGQRVGYCLDLDGHVIGIAECSAGSG